jgi:hypothetical protein
LRHGRGLRRGECGALRAHQLLALHERAAVHLAAKCVDDNRQPAARLCLERVRLWGVAMRVRLMRVRGNRSQAALRCARGSTCSRRPTLDRSTRRAISGTEPPGAAASKSSLKAHTARYTPAGRLSALMTCE